MSEMEFHEAANIFPLDEAFIADLAEHIREHGLHVAIETLGGKVLDGRHRYLACGRAGVEPRFVEVQAKCPVEHVKVRNLKRWHASASVRAMGAAEAEELQARYRREAEGRQRLSMGRGVKGQIKGSDLNGEAGQSRDRIGKDFNVSGVSVQRAMKVCKDGIPELKEAVRNRRMSVGKAAEVAALSAEAQREEVNRPKKKRKSKAKAPKATPLAAGSDPKLAKARIKAFDLCREAINVLSRIPTTNIYRGEALQVVKKWLKDNP